MKTQIMKRCGAVLATLCMTATLIPVGAISAIADSADEIVCDISKGSVTIQNDKITYTNSSGETNTQSVSSSTPIVITGSTTENTVKVLDYDDAPLDITLRDCTIDVSAVASDDGTGYKSMCAVYLGGESTTWNQGRVNLTIEGTNVLKSLDYAGLAIPAGETVVIDGTGSLDASTSACNSGTSAPGIGAPVSNYNAPECFLSSALDGSFGTIIINGGTITATSGTAGIGGGQRNVSGTIVINGGNVTATAGTSSAAGIGCGQDSTLSAIIITGGTIVATGSSSSGGSGAGIGGGGMHTDSGIIMITGGDITATGGNYAPGIGGSNTNSYGHGWAQQINITGGTIRAYGGAYAAGIGAGAPYGCSDMITISGGTIYAYGGAGSVSTGEATQRAMVDGQMTMSVVGTSTKIYAPGAGIGNSGAYAAITAYTSGDNAGTTSTSQTANWGGKVTITGGTVYAYAGTLDEESTAALAETGYELAAASAIGEGGYIADLLSGSEGTAATVSISGATVYEEGVLVAATSVAKSSVKKITAGKKKMTITLNVASDATSCIVYYRVKGSKTWKSKTVTSNKLTVKKLKKGKKYQVKVVSVLKVGGQTLKSAASAVKTSKKIK